MLSAMHLIVCRLADVRVGNGLGSSCKLQHLLTINSLGDLPLHACSTTKLTSALWERIHSSTCWQGEHSRCMAQARQLCTVVQLSAIAHLHSPLGRFISMQLRCASQLAGAATSLCGDTACCRAIQFFTPGVPMIYYVVSAANLGAVCTAGMPLLPQAQRRLSSCELVLSHALDVHAYLCHVSKSIVCSARQAK